MLDVDSKHVFEVAPSEDEHPVQALAPDGVDESLGEDVSPRRPDRVDHVPRRCRENQQAHVTEVPVRGIAYLLRGIAQITTLTAPSAVGPGTLGRRHRFCLNRHTGPTGEANDGVLQRIGVMQNRCGMK